MVSNNVSFPPYGRILAERQRQRRIYHNDVFLFMGDNAWKKAKYFHDSNQSVLVLPYNTFPEDYIWPVEALYVLVFDMYPEGASEEIIKRLALQLLRASARCVAVCGFHRRYSTVVFKPDKKVQGGTPLC